jgi:hypothetical protein
MNLKRLSVQTILLLGVTAAIVVVGALNLQARLKNPSIPYDGVTWVDTEQGVKAEIVDSQGPAARSGIRAGDRLIGISLNEGRDFDEVTQASYIQTYLDKASVGKPISYMIERRNAYGDPSRWAADIPEIKPKPQRLAQGIYLAVIGLVYLIIGLYVLMRQGRSPYTRHFYLICLTAFVVHFYSFTEQFDGLDQAVFLADNVAWILFAPLFLHFAAIFPVKQQIVERRRLVTALIYLPAILMVGLEVAQMTSLIPTVEPLLRIRTGLDSAIIIQFITCFLVGGGLLVRTFTKAETPILRQQMKWVVWGLGVSIIPFTAFQTYSHFINPNAPFIAEVLGVGPLLLIPLSFGYSILRYRLMDVDVIMRRRFVHVVATAMVLGLYSLLLIRGTAIVDWVVPNAPLRLVQAVTLVSMLIIALLFGPVKNWLQVKMDRLFYGRRYGARASLGEFIQTISATTTLERLLGSLAERLNEMLSVDKIAVFIEDRLEAAGYRVAYVSGVDEKLTLPGDFAEVVRSRASASGVLSIDVDQWLPESFLRSVDDLHYFVPCVVRDRLIAIIGLGRTSEGDLLTSEDIELLKAISGYVAVAVENSMLYLEQAERAAELAHLKEFNESIVESINVGILAVTPEGRITTWNSALEELLGIARRDAVGQPLHRVLDPDLVRALRDVTGPFGWAVAESRSIYKFRLVAADGRDLVLNLSITPFETTQGQTVGSLIAIEDMTHRVRLEEQLQQREKLSSIGLLAAGIAHEVNTPLTGISSYTQMLLKQIPRTDPRFKLLEKIENQAARASNIVSNLLNFSRTERTELARLDIHKVLDDTLQLLEPQLRNTEIELVRRYTDDVPPLMGNATKLQQVFMNLVLNARDAMPTGGELTIETYSTDSMVCVEVSDTGVGIPPEHIAKIYDPFFTTKEVGRGTGLGLALSFGIIQEHAGRIFVDSKLGSGTRFTIKFPAAAIGWPVYHREDLREDLIAAAGD